MNNYFSVELQSLEQQLEEAHTENFNIKQMKDLFEQKAAQLATEIAGKLNQDYSYPISQSLYLFAVVYSIEKQCILV